ncbi:SIMPL domain-containing protein [Candidatus Kaiserbacteria bacterium]|nr:SIMPL domain-containing protein [Candidatus Kaiserbacteria bacterium]
METTENQKGACVSCDTQGCHGCYGHHGSHRGLKKVVLVMIAVALAAYTYLTLKEADHVSMNEGTISITGEGEVIARPDIAQFSFGVSAEAEDAATAKQISAEAINAILDYLKEEGIEDADIKTQYYNLSPRYDYLRPVCPNGSFCPGAEQVLRGYEVSQSIEVKVRDIDTVGDLISGVGERGATNISGVQFTIDDEDVLRAEARDAAIVDAKEKAEKLADALGVRLVRVISFWEDSPMYYGGEMMYDTMSMKADVEEIAPQIPVGETTYTSRVTVSYEIR